MCILSSPPSLGFKNKADILKIHICFGFNIITILPFRFVFFYSLFYKNVTSEWLHGHDLSEKRKHCLTLAARLGSCSISGLYVLPQR